MASTEAESMTFTHREMQSEENKGFFQLEIARQTPTHRTLNNLLTNVLGKTCQKT